MSYARFLSYDIYMYANSPTGVTCCGCSLMPTEHHVSLFFGEGDWPTNFYAKNTQDAVDHVKQHEANGDRVPADIYDRLWADDKDNFPEETK